MIYLDNSATTEISAAAKKKMIEAMEIYGNPSSTHASGIEARRIIEEAREKVAAALGVGRVNTENLIFTACGSESNNTAILGVAYAKEKRRANKIITTDSEHPSVENVMKKLEKDGFEVIRISTRGGVVNEQEFLSAVDDKTLLVSMMLVNNETGAAYDIKKLFSMAKRKNPDIVTHCDAVQGFLKVPFTPKTVSADLVSISAHKIHGPKGVGALYISPEIIKAKKIIPYIIGGGQEGGYRSGTENIVGIAGFGAAAEEARANFAQNTAKMIALRDRCEKLALDAGARPNVPSGMRAPHVLSVTLPDIKSETMLNYLSGAGVCVSAGSACSAHSRNMSPTLLGFGLSEREADCTIRISFSSLNTEADVETFAKELAHGIDTLVRIKH
ncbi:MAG: cysteine desulfurase [Ruminococcaceae bacterium]|nr:cysteine desulfurase [Oscillospiraceae bacterium]